MLDCACSGQAVQVETGARYCRLGFDFPACDECPYYTQGTLVYEDWLDFEEIDPREEI